VHQPDQNQPDQILGICLKCGRWYRIGWTARTNKLIVLELPDLTHVSSIIAVERSEEAC